MQNFEPLPRFKVTSPLTIFKKVTCILKGKESFNGFTTYDDSVFKTYSIQNQGEIWIERYDEDHKSIHYFDYSKMLSI